MSTWAQPARRAAAPSWWSSGRRRRPGRAPAQARESRSRWNAYESLLGRTSIRSVVSLLGNGRGGRVRRHVHDLLQVQHRLAVHEALRELGPEILQLVRKCLPQDRGDLVVLVLHRRIEPENVDVVAAGTRLEPLEDTPAERHLLALRIVAFGERFLYARHHGFEVRRLVGPDLVEDDPGVRRELPRRGNGGRRRTARSRRSAGAGRARP